MMMFKMMAGCFDDDVQDDGRKLLFVIMGMRKRGGLKFLQILIRRSLDDFPVEFRDPFLDQPASCNPQIVNMMANIAIG